VTPRLDGLRVLDLTHEGFAYAPYLLALLGAEIVEVGRTPAADERARWTRLGPTLDERRRDLDHPDLPSLLREADVVCESLPPGTLRALALDYEDLAPANPKLVWASITPFGRSGPRREWTATNLIGWAVSGLLPSIGDPDRAPLVPGGPIPLGDLLASIHAAIGILLAVRVRRLSGSGQLVDVSLQATTVAATCELGVAAFLDDMIPRRRIGNRRRQLAPSGLYRCTDGYASVVILPVAHWDALARWMHEKCGNETALDPMFRDLATRVETAELLESWVEELTAHFSKQELFEEGQRRGISITPVNTLADLASDPQLIARGWWREPAAETGGAKVAGAPFRFRD
jgi:benzylsuccinate CoA-transferase BbsE subunit